VVRRGEFGAAARGGAGISRWNFPPAKIFMGDSGSMVIGFILGVLTVRTTFLQPGTNFGAGWYAVFAPVIVLALPLYDMIVVSLIRLARGKSPFVGDTNQFQSPACRARDVTSGRPCFACTSSPPPPASRRSCCRTCNRPSGPY
jgi:UDP-N-acetylmuramyl pentapeptide phosphotransferase/UDP-N-acetylglucosamine-1-phosphate transferase